MALIASSLTDDELIHYGSLGDVVGLDPAVAQRLQSIKNRLSQKLDDLEAWDDVNVDQLRDDRDALKEALKEVFEYQPNRKWFPKAFQTYQEID